MEPGSLATLQTPIIVFLIALSARALFSFLETSITALRLFKLKELAASTTQYRALFNSLEKSPHRVLITILIASSFSEVTAAALATHIMETFFAYLNFSGSLGFSLGIAIATIAILIFGEIIPKNIAKGSGERLFRSTLWITNILFHTLYPIVTVLLRFSSWFVTKISHGNRLESTEWVSSEKEIQFLIDYIGEKGLMEIEKTEMLQNIFDLGRTPVKEILVPAADIVAISSDTSMQDTIKVFLNRRFTRLPIYETSLDNVIGMVHLKDIFAVITEQQDKQLKDIVRPIMFVPDSMKINQLLRKFRQQHMHIAMVLNEHGSTTGLITLEDVLEEIVGDISDEHELATQKIIKLKQGGWLVHGSTPLQDLQDFLAIDFKSESSLTIGGFLIENLQHLPKKGERVLYNDYYFQIQKSTPKRVLQVLIFKADGTQSSSNSE